MTYPSCNKDSVTELEIEAKCLITYISIPSHQIQDLKSEKLRRLAAEETGKLS